MSAAKPPFGDGIQAWGTLESTTRFGDSGSPSFRWNDNGNSIIEQGELVLFGVNTFGLPGSAQLLLFGSLAGGMLVSTYATWIQQHAVPEPTTYVMLVTGACGLFGHPSRRRRSALIPTSVDITDRADRLKTIRQRTKPKS